MFRRRRAFQANPLTADQMAILVKANQLMSAGKPLEAGPLFTSVADTVQESKHPRRAANLYARASHAFTDGNQAQTALANARKALDLFIQTRMVGRAATFYANITRKMNAKGMQSQADTLQREYGGQIASLAAKPLTPGHARQGLLPTNCTKCGAPIHAEELTWVDENTIECEYCGAFIRSE